MAANGIYDVLKQRIVLLDYEPGQVLREKDLVEAFGVSRTPVREALLLLEAEGLVRIIPNLGTIVSEVSFQQLRDVFEVRSFLVRLTGQLAAARVTDEELEAMRAHAAQLRRETDPKTLMRLDSELHDMINRATKNEVLVKILGMLRDQAVRIWTFSKADDAFWGGMADDFDRLIEAFEHRDEERSARILEHHTRQFIEHIRSQFAW